MTRLTHRLWLLAVLSLQMLAPVTEAADQKPAPAWPRVTLPRDMRTFDIAQEVALNGSPMRLQGFVSSATPDQLLAQFRQSLGEPLVESRLGTQRILGRPEGDFYLSVQIEPAAQGSRGTVAITHLKGAEAAQGQTRLDREQWLDRLPAGSRLLSSMLSQDGASQSRHIVFANDHGEALNRERLVSLMQQDGLSFEREGSAGDSGAGAAAGRSGRVLFFKGSSRQAMATISRDSGGITTVVLNVVTRTGALK